MDRREAERRVEEFYNLLRPFTADLMLQRVAEELERPSRDWASFAPQHTPDSVRQWILRLPDNLDGIFQYLVILRMSPGELGPILNQAEVHDTLHDWFRRLEATMQEVSSSETEIEENREAAQGEKEHLS